MNPHEVHVWASAIMDVAMSFMVLMCAIITGILAYAFFKACQEK